MSEDFSSKFKETRDSQITNNKADFNCVIHGEGFSVNISDIENNMAACSSCNKLLNVMENSEHEIQKVIKNISATFNDKFDYMLFGKLSVTEDGIIICPEHGIQKMSLKSHLTDTNGSGCNLCSLAEKELARGNPKKITDNWMDHAIKRYKSPKK